MSNKRSISIVLAAFAISVCATTAHAATWVVKPKFVKPLSTGTIIRGAIQVEVSKDGAPAPNDVKVIIERFKGDAQLFKSATELTDKLELKTAGGTGIVTADLAMGTEPEVIFLATAVDPADATKTVRELFGRNSREDIPTGEDLGCFRDADGNKESDDEWRDCREDNTYFTFYSGYAVNTFANSALGGGGTTTSSDVIAGIDFGHALFRRKRNPDGSEIAPTLRSDGTKAYRRGRGELWVYGETLHGIANTNNCVPAAGTQCPTPPADATDALTGVIKDAATLEAYTGLRYEFQVFPILDDTASRLYAKAQIGFISIRGKGVDLIDNHHGALGITKVHGRFTDSYFEVGYGRNDLFKDQNNGRWKFDALVQMNTKWPAEAMIRPFIQFCADTDFGRGEDSVQTFFGLDFDLTLLKIFSVAGRN